MGLPAAWCHIFCANKMIQRELERKKRGSLNAVRPKAVGVRMARRFYSRGLAGAVDWITSVSRGWRFYFLGSDNRHG